MDKKPEVSLIIPVYNVEPYLKQCFDSVVMQSFRDMEILVIDDGSTDGSGDLCDRYAESDSRITVFHTSNYGLSAARNYGLDRMSGRYVMFLDSDDWLEPNAVECMYENIEKSEADIVVCQRIHEPTKKAGTSSSMKSATLYTSSRIIEEFLNGFHIGNIVWNKIYRVELFNRTRYPEGRIYEDIATTYKLLEASDSALVIPEALYHYRLRDTSLSNIHSAKNLIDYWTSYREMYEGLILKYPECKPLLTGKVVNAAGKTWRWYDQLSRDGKDELEPYIKQMQRFAKENYRYVMKSSTCSRLQKFQCFFARSKSPLVFKALYTANQIYRAITRIR